MHRHTQKHFYMDNPKLTAARLLLWFSESLSQRHICTRALGRSEVARISHSKKSSVVEKPQFSHVNVRSGTIVDSTEVLFITH